MPISFDSPVNTWPPISAGSGITGTWGTGPNGEAARERALDPDDRREQTLPRVRQAGRERAGGWAARAVSEVRAKEDHGEGGVMEHVYLVGSEQVQHAASSMRQATQEARG